MNTPFLWHLFCEVGIISRASGNKVYDSLLCSHVEVIRDFYILRGFGDLCILRICLHSFQWDWRKKALSFTPCINLWKSLQLNLSRVFFSLFLFVFILVGGKIVVPDIASSSFRQTSLHWLRRSMVWLLMPDIRVFREERIYSWRHASADFAPYQSLCEHWFY